MSRDVESLLRMVVRRIRVRFPQVRRIILFGSYAEGRPTRHSDLDLFVVMPMRRRGHDRARQLHAVFPDRPLPMDFVVRTPREVRERLTTYFCPFTREVMARGRVLYEAPARHP
jgi:predicted nucleotidyltransferase